MCCGEYSDPLYLIHCSRSFKSWRHGSKRMDGYDLHIKPDTEEAW